MEIRDWSRTSAAEKRIGSVACGCENGEVSAVLLSVNVATPRPASYAKPVYKTAIDKRPVNGPTKVEQLGLEGDQVADTKYHGGVHQAVYVFAREDLDLWGERIGRRIENGQFGENFTTSGIDVNEALLGERWKIGTAVFEVAEVRIPCRTFQGWLGELGVDNTAWVKRFTAEERPGPYLRVVQPGLVSAGDEITVISRPDHEVSVSMMFRAFTTDRSLLPRLLDVGDSLAPKPRAAAERAAQEALSAKG